MFMLDHYEKRLDRLEIQFQFLRHAVEEMSNSAVKRLREFLSSTFFTKLVDEEVERVDRLSLAERFKYFEKYFELGFMTPNEKNNETIKALEALSHLRNIISHEIMNPDAVTHVSAINLQEARKRYGDVPRKLIALAKKKHPKYFS